MRKQAPAIKYSVRGVSPELDNALRRKAELAQQSLNQVILDALTEAAIGCQKKADFSDLIGRWIPDPAFDETLAVQWQVDPDKWK